MYVNTKRTRSRSGSVRNFRSESGPITETNMKHKMTVVLMMVLISTHTAFAQDLMKLDGVSNILDESYAAKEDPVPAEPRKEEPAPETDDYKVGVDDVLDINVIKPETIQSIVTVAPDGTITFPYIGNVYVKNMTLPSIQEEVQKRLANGYMEFPIVSVSLRQTRSKKFTIYGQVAKPGGYPVEEGMTLLRAITDAGGFIVPGSIGRVKILRPKTGSKESEVTEFNITDILNGKDQDSPVKAGDTVVVTVDKFFIYGQVLRPGAYPVEENMTILHAVTQAGGFIESASTGRVRLSRPKKVNQEAKMIEAGIKSILDGTSPNTAVLPGDTITVTLDKFYISGQVNRPGAYPVEEGMTILNAITSAGGFIESGSTGKVKLFRPKNGMIEAKTIETDIKAITSGSSSNAIVLAGDTISVSLDKFYISGQVNRPGAYSVEDRMTLLSAVTQAGGFLESGATGKIKLVRSKTTTKEAQVIESDITSILKGGDQDVIVRAGDSIVVSSDKFFVYGEIARPGVYPLEASTTTLTAISIAGGFTKFGAANRVKVLRVIKETGVYDTIKVNINEVMAGDSKADVILKPNDIVVVSESVF